MVPFSNLAAQHASIRSELEPAIAEAIFGGDFVLGRHVSEFEAAFAAFCGARHGIGVNSGTSALHLALLAAGVGAGDEVITTAFTFVATVAAIAYTGARPVLVDIEPDTLNIDAGRIEAAISPRTRAIIPVHLYGQPANMDAVMAIAARHGLAVIEDAAQAHAAEYRGRRVGSLGDAACFSFYPSKNLGAAGDAGMVVTNRDDWALQINQLRSWGAAAPSLQAGFNYRMAGIQAALLNVKLRHLLEWTERRRANAALYDAALLGPALKSLKAPAWARHVYHIYGVRTDQRDAMRREFSRLGIETRVHYPLPVHLVEEWKSGYRAGDFPNAECAAQEVLSLPVYPELNADQVAAVAAAIETISMQPAREAPPRARKKERGRSTAATHGAAG